MTKITTNKTHFKNPNSPFTELFSLLQCHEQLTDGRSTMSYKSDALKVMHLHIDNAMDVLLRGMQDVGTLLNMVLLDKSDLMRSLHNVGYFISVISNLTEALNNLRLDSDYVLRQRGFLKY